MTKITRTEHGVKLTAEAPHHDPEAVALAQRAVARACLEHRGALERAARLLDGRKVSHLDAQDVYVILAALDAWRAVSIAPVKDINPPTDHVDRELIETLRAVRRQYISMADTGSNYLVQKEAANTMTKRVSRVLARVDGRAANAEEAHVFGVDVTNDLTEIEANRRECSVLTARLEWLTFDRELLGF